MKRSAKRLALWSALALLAFCAALWLPGGREVADTLLGAGEGWLTELSNEELKGLLLLDRKEALA